MFIFATRFFLLRSVFEWWKLIDSKRISFNGSSKQFPLSLTKQPQLFSLEISEKLQRYILLVFMKIFNEFVCGKYFKDNWKHLRENLEFNLRNVFQFKLFFLFSRVNLTVTWSEDISFLEFLVMIFFGELEEDRKWLMVKKVNNGVRKC